MEENYDIVPGSVTEILPSHEDETSPPTPSDVMELKETESLPELDSELLSALGDTGEDAPVYGENIHPDLAQRWLPILRKGLNKEVKDRLLKDYVVPENCKQLRAPTLNPEIMAAVNDGSKARDKKIESGQQQLGSGITAVSRALSLLLTNDEKPTKILAIKILSDACRILTDLHSSETQSRIKAITPLLDKTFLSVIQDVERDEFLFGTKLAEKIKASKAIEKQGLQIKKTGPIQKGPAPSTSQNQSATRPRFQGNWTAPPRFQSSNRGGRGAAQRTTQATRRTQPAFNQSRSSNYKQHRAQTRH